MPKCVHPFDMPVCRLRGPSGRPLDAQPGFQPGHPHLQAVEEFHPVAQPGRQHPPVRQPLGGRGRRFRSHRPRLQHDRHPYRWGGTTPKKGFDCSGLVNYVFQDVDDVDLPRTARAIYNMDNNKVSRGKLQPGDLVFFRIRSRSVDRRHLRRQRPLRARAAARRSASPTSTAATGNATTWPASASCRPPSPRSKAPASADSGACGSLRCPVAPVSSAGARCPSRSTAPPARSARRSIAARDGTLRRGTVPPPGTAAPVRRS